MKKEHIYAIPKKYIPKATDGWVDYTVYEEYVMLGMRDMLEQDNDYRQVLPIVVFVNGDKIWAYERTPSGGEAGLHGKLAIAVGGHFDMTDTVYDERGYIDIRQSVLKAVNRELIEEIGMSFNIENFLPDMIASDDTDVDSKHIALIGVIHTDYQIKPREDALKELGWLSPDDIINNPNSETWAVMIAKKLSEDGLVND